MFQLHLQIYVILNDGFGEESDFENGIKIVSIITSFVSLMYGMASYNLHQLYQTEVGLVQVFKFLLVNLLCQMVMMLLPLCIMFLCSTVIFVTKPEELNCTLTEETEFFQNNSVIWKHNQTREAVEMEYGEVVNLSLIYIVLTLTVAFLTICTIEIVNKKEISKRIIAIIVKALDPNNIANPLNSLYSSISYSKEEKESLPELRRRVSLAHFCYSFFMYCVLSWTWRHILHGKQWKTL